MNYFDLHCDTISECYKQKLLLDTNNLQISIKKGSRIDKWIQVYAVWIDDVLEKEAAYNQFNEVYQYFLQQLSYNRQQMKWCTSSKMFQEHLDKGQRIAILSIEGSRALGGRLERVEEFYCKGVRIMTLTWNGRCEVGDGCMTERAGGLTEFGRAVVERMEKLGMIVDVSHLAEKGFWQVEKMAKKPFIASHSNSQWICNVPRNLSDEQFCAMVSHGCLVGMNFYPVFINGTKRAHIKELLPHIDHFLELGGEDAIGMGSDFDGASMPIGLKNIEDISRLETLLLQRYGKEKTEKFMFENSYNFFMRNLS